MKKILVFIFLMLFSSCSKEKNECQYSLDRLESFKKVNNLYTNASLINFDNEVTSPASAPYGKEELKNLDFNKEVNFKDLYFRIPSKCEIFRKDKAYYIDFPFTDSYDILIDFKDLASYELNSYDFEEIYKKIIKKDKLTNFSKLLENPNTNAKSAYFISHNDKYTYTHFIVKGPLEPIYFTIKEDTTKSMQSENIMADMLMTCYSQGLDPLEVKKDFKDYKNSLNIFASEKVIMDKISIPENFYLNQETDKLKSYLAKDGAYVIGEIIVIEDDKNDNIYDVFNKNSGDLIYPTQIVNMGPIEEDKNHIESSVRMYLPTNTLAGKKYTIDNDDCLLTIFVIGPLKNDNLTKVMAKNIINSIKKLP